MSKYAYVFLCLFVSVETKLLQIHFNQFGFPALKYVSKSGIHVKVKGICTECKNSKKDNKAVLSQTGQTSHIYIQLRYFRRSPLTCSQD